MTSTSAVGIDVGRSTVKVVARQNGQSYKLMFPSAVTAGRAAAVFGELQKQMDEDTVQQNGQFYWTGQTSIDQSLGADPVGRTDDWVVGQPHNVLIQSAIERLVRQGFAYVPSETTVALGVPSRVFVSRKDLLPTIVANTQRVLGKDNATPVVHVFPQPMGVITCHTLDEDGLNHPGRNIETESYAVVEVGQYTTDFTAIVNGKPIIEATSSCDGVELVVTHLRSELNNRGLTLGSAEVQTLFQNPVLRVRGETVDIRSDLNRGIKQVLMPQILEAFAHAFHPTLLQKVDRILVAGGGAPIVYDELRALPSAQHALMLNEPRMAVADGFARIAAMLSKANHA